MASRLAQIANQLTPNANAIQKSDYAVLEQPIGTTRRLRVACVGAGMSGMNMIRTLRLHLTNYEHVVYEKNPQVGGTWYENRYPGCKCDVPSHNYQFSWRPNPEWSEFFSPASEIQEYLCRVCDEEKMGEVIKFEHLVNRAEWREETGTWRLSVLNQRTNETFEDYCHFLLDGSGILNNWKWPAIPGLHDFQGTLLHTANWANDFSWHGKTVAVIGNGSSGVQVLPEAQKGKNVRYSAKHVVHFVREPTWIVPSRLQLLAQGAGEGILNEIELDEEGKFSARQVEKFKSDPAFYHQFVKLVEEVVNGNFPITQKNTQFAKQMQQNAKAYMMAALNGDERLCNAMIPDFELGCRRLTPGVGYLESLSESNVTVVTDPIVKIVAGGLETSAGQTIAVDAIICATGFDVSFRPRFPIIGRKGNLQDTWSQNLPKAYMSCAVPTFPNFFTFLGPNAPIGHGSVFTITEHIAKYLTRIIKKCQTENIKAIEPSQRAVDDLFEHIQAFMPRTSWSGNCISWFKNGTVDGPVTALHPGSRIHFFHMLESFRGEDWEYTYLEGRNRFAYLGNGYSTKELGDGDPTWYLDEPDKM